MIRMNVLKFLIVLSSILNMSKEIFCGNILFLNSVASPSHHLWNRKLADGLAMKGYNITMVSADNDHNQVPNVHYIILESVYDTIYNDDSTFDLFKLAELSYLPEIFGFYEFCELNCDGILKSKGLSRHYP